MYPDLEMARNRIAELHHLAERADLAIAIGRARRAHRDRAGTRKGPGRMPPTAPGTPKSAPQRRRTPNTSTYTGRRLGARLLRVLRTVGNPDHRAAEVVFSCITSARRELPLLPLRAHNLLGHRLVATRCGRGRR